VSEQSEDIFAEPENLWCFPPEWQHWIRGLLQVARDQEEAVAELYAKLERSASALRRVDAWFDELEMHTAPDYHLAPALQEVKAVLKELDKNGDA